MSQEKLKTSGKDGVEAIWQQLRQDLTKLNTSNGKDQNVISAIGNHLSLYAKQDKTYEDVLELSHILGFLQLAIQQRSSQEYARALDEIDLLIQSCLEPFKRFIKTPDTNPPISPNPMPVFFQDKYLARPKGLIPFLIVPNYSRKAEDWVGVGHEVGHYIYRRIPYLQEEIEIVMARVLEPFPKFQQRLWFHYLEESFADLIGIMSLGAAFLYAQQVIIRSSTLTFRYARSSVDNPERLLMGDDLAHPIPLLRGELGLCMYGALLQQPSNSADYSTLYTNWQEVTSNFASPIYVRDPHFPHSPLVQDVSGSTGQLSYTDILEVKDAVIPALLNTKLRSLGNQSLCQLIDFMSDENERLTLVELPEDELRAKNTDKKVVAAACLIANRDVSKLQ